MFAHFRLLKNILKFTLNWDAKVKHPLITIKTKYNEGYKFTNIRCRNFPCKL